MENNKTFWDYIPTNSSFDLYVVSSSNIIEKYAHVQIRWDSMTNIVSFHAGGRTILSRDKQVRFTYDDLQTSSLETKDKAYVLNGSEAIQAYKNFRKRDIQRMEEAKSQFQFKIKQIDKNIEECQKFIDDPWLDVEIRTIES